MADATDWVAVMSRASQPRPEMREFAAILTAADAGLNAENTARFPTSPRGRAAVVPASPCPTRHARIQL